MMVEVLGRTIKYFRDTQVLKGLISAPNCTTTIHHQFVDDTIFIGRVERGEAIQFKKVLNIYEKASYQKINFQKNKLYLLKCYEISKKRIIKVWGCKIDELPTRYLGMPLYIGRLKY